MKKRSTTLLLGVFAASALLGACGDDKKSGGGATSDAAYCKKIESYKAKADELDSVMQGSDPAAIKGAFTTMQGMIHDLDKKPPASIAADVHTMTDAVDKIVTIFEKYDWDFNKLATAPEAADLSTIMDNDAVNTASDNLDTYTSDVCGLDTSS